MFELPYFFVQLGRSVVGPTTARKIHISYVCLHGFSPGILLSEINKFAFTSSLSASSFPFRLSSKIHTCSTAAKKIVSTAVACSSWPIICDKSEEVILCFCLLANYVFSLGALLFTCTIITTSHVRRHIFRRKPESSFPPLLPSFASENCLSQVPIAAEPAISAKATNK